MAATIREQITAELERIPDIQLPGILDSLRILHRKPFADYTVRSFAKRIGGSIPPDEMDRIDKAIEEAFEIVEAD